MPDLSAPGGQRDIEATDLGFWQLLQSLDA
jgi:hypothetical protein